MNRKTLYEEYEVQEGGGPKVSEDNVRGLSLDECAEECVRGRRISTGGGEVCRHYRRTNMG